jgi:hypothetical protein
MGDELLSLPAADFPCYDIYMDHHNDLFPSPEGRGDRGEVPRAASMIKQKTTFDGTKLPIVDSHPETTTHGMKLLFCLNSTIANRAIPAPR